MVSSQAKIQHPDHSLKWKLKHTTKASKKNWSVKEKCGHHKRQRWEGWQAWSWESQRHRCWVHQAVQHGQLLHLGSRLVGLSNTGDQTFFLSMISKHNTEHNIPSLWNLGFYRMFDKKEPSSSHVTTNFVINYAALE